MPFKKIPHSYLGRVFKNLSLTASFNADGITISSLQSGCQKKETKLTWQQVDSPPYFTLHMKGYSLNIISSGQVYQITHLSYFSKLRFNAFIFQQWATGNQQQLRKLVTRVEQAITKQYPRDSLLNKIRTRVATEHQRWQSCYDSKTELSNDAQLALLELKKIHLWNDTDVEQKREDYVHTQLTRHHDFFENVESNPLTEKQRIACVIDDDNNLLLAGAGTGKTSVMVGRTGYLLNSEQASAPEILLLAYGKIAAEEMDERIKSKLNTDAVKATTFHSLGLKIIAEVEGCKPSLSPWVNDEKSKSKWVHNTLENLILEPTYLSLVLEYFSQYYYVEKNPFEFKTEGEYFEYLTANDIRTLKSERVKSFGELYIANWLFRNGIEYQYEAKYKHDVSCVEYRQYEPDFYLPEYDIYIEYYGTDELDNTAPYIDNTAYLASMAWKRELHNTHSTHCIELFYHQHRDGHLIVNLESALDKFELQCSPLPDKAVLATLHELGQVSELAKLFNQLIGLYKAACLDDGGLQQVIDNSADKKQTEKALELLQPILARYQQHLATNGMIDFEDMIAKALSYLQQGLFKSPWRYIMVDEFQDISEPRARLVRALRDANPQASLFCVGDDWQAIYRFSGADVSLTTQFKNYFGATAQTYLDLTFRFNNSIGDVATKFVTQNPIQLKKEISSKTQVNTPAISIIRRGINQGATATNASETALEQALMAINTQEITRQQSSKKEQITKTASVYLLARYWFQLPDHIEVQRLNIKYPSINIECQSFHASKGKEADYVVITGLTTGKHGFPSQKVTPPLLDALLPKSEDFEFAEERRLFYVALTRAKHRAYILADMTDVSPFVVELIKENYAVELDEFETSFVQKLFEEMKCVRCTTGALKEKQGKFGSFYSCSHFPLCEHTENSCEQCNSPMTRQRFAGFQTCLNDECSHMRPLCTVCGAEMIFRTSKYGGFWGCRNHRRDNPLSCRNTIDNSRLVLPKNSLTS